MSGGFDIRNAIFLDGRPIYLSGVGDVVAIADSFLAADARSAGWHCFALNQLSGTADSLPVAVSADGHRAVGNAIRVSDSSAVGVMWNLDDYTATELSHPAGPFNFTAINGNGSVYAAYDSGGGATLYWSGGSATTLLPPAPYPASYLNGMSEDGTFFVGGTALTDVLPFPGATYWNLAIGTTGLSLPFLDSGQTQAFAVSSDKNVIFGQDLDFGSIWRPVKWVGGHEVVLPSLGSAGNFMLSGSRDGSTAVGFTNDDGGGASKALVWPNSTSVVALEPIPGSDQAYGRAYAVSDDLLTVVGISTISTGSSRAVVWHGAVLETSCTLQPVARRTRTSPSFWSAPVILPAPETAPWTGDDWSESRGGSASGSVVIGYGQVSGVVKPLVWKNY